MNSDGATGHRSRRRAERRHGVEAILEELARRIGGPPDGLRACLQEAAARLCGGRSASITERDPRARATGARADGAWRIEVPGGTAELAIEGSHDPDGWDRQQARALADLSALVLEIERLRGGSPRARGARRPPVLVGASPAMVAVRARIAQVARSSVPVLIQGESGVGKEVVARLVHEQSRRARGPFVAVNCAAIVDTLVEAELFGIEDRTATGVRGRRGKFEQADGGTLLLDEIGDLAPAAQAKLLRVLQDLTVERVGGHTGVSVDVRVVAATNRDLGALVREGRFRADLYYRLNGVEIDVPPLRERLDDLPSLVAHVLERCDALGVLRVEDTVLVAMRDYAWPGNVRELERVIERALALCDADTLRVEHLPPRIAGAFAEVVAPALREMATLRSFAARYVRFTVQQLGNRRQACRVLDISSHTLRTYLHSPETRWERRPARAAGETPAAAQVPMVADRPAAGFEPPLRGRAPVP